MSDIFVPFSLLGSTGDWDRESVGRLGFVFFGSSFNHTAFSIEMRNKVTKDLWSKQDVQKMRLDCALVCQVWQARGGRKRSDDVRGLRTKRISKTPAID